MGRVSCNFLIPTAPKKKKKKRTAILLLLFICEMKKREARRQLIILVVLWLAGCLAGWARRWRWPILYLPLELVRRAILIRFLAGCNHKIRACRRSLPKVKERVWFVSYSLFIFRWAWLWRGTSFALLFHIIFFSLFYFCILWHKPMQ